ncbi:MAG: hypothetical protein ABSG31_07255 [Tepidisphaeraceae bacterium]|jgi:hypothetical protein
MIETPTLEQSHAETAPLFGKPAEFDEAWKDRIAHLATFIDTTGPVADIGCGMMWLEPLLVRGNRYIPIDYVRRDDRTLLVDLNEEPLPPIYAEFAFMSGVLEYIRDVPGFLRQIMARRFRRILLTYCSLECWWKLPVRKSLNWVSHESVEDLLNVLLPEYSVVALERFQNHVALVVELREP